MKILVIEDDPKIASFLVNGFKEAGFVVDSANDGMEGLDLALIHTYDAAVIDLMLPTIDGLSIIAKMRSEKVMLPVIILSAKGSVSDRVRGLQAGGDDYVVKPFSFSELLARVHALIRRSAGSSDAEESGGSLKVADLMLDPWKREVRRGEEVIQLHAREFALLEFFMRNPGRVLSKTAVLENVYDYSFDPQTNVVDVLVHRLRKKIDDSFDHKLIHTIRGMGYVLKEA
ncbi:MAG: response regulator transcription factor [Verrucomicrobiae bacterium]|nr:response regulator transcription factor [Verrucomicrobiae bacterium]